MIVAMAIAAAVAMIAAIALVAAINTYGCVLVMFNSRSRGAAIRNGVRMHVISAIRPGPHPGAAIDQDVVLAPAEAGSAPSEGTEGSANGDAWSKPEQAAHHETGARPRIHNRRVVIRHVVVARIHRKNLYVARTVYLYVLVLRELWIVKITIVVSLLAHALYSVHHITALLQHRVAELLGP